MPWLTSTKSIPARAAAARSRVGHAQAVMTTEITVKSALSAMEAERSARSAERRRLAGSRTAQLAHEETMQQPARL